MSGFREVPMGRLLSAAAGLAAVLALASAAAATIVLRVSPRELADTAHLVVEGRVATVDVRWNDDRSCINTYAVVNVDRVHKGPGAGSVTVVIPGGRLGDQEVRVEGTARLESGEECFLFLWRNARGEYLVLGEAQGKFRLTRDAKTGLRMAENSLKGLCLVVRGEPKKAGNEAAKRSDCLCADDLAAVVRASVEAQGKAPAPAPAPAGGTASTPAGAPATATGTGETAAPGTTEIEGRVPAPQPATPDPPSTTTTPGAGAPPPTKDAPAPPAGTPDTSGQGAQEPKPPVPAPESK
jgi:hypothetical protein